MQCPSSYEQAYRVWAGRGGAPSSDDTNLGLFAGRAGHTEGAVRMAEARRAKARGPGQWMQVAVLYAAAVAGLPPQERPRADGYANQGIAAAGAAVKAGFRDAFALEHDPDLAPLAKYPAFMQVVALARGEGR
jgi:hypothetical protein